MAEKNDSSSILQYSALYIFAPSLNNFQYKCTINPHRLKLHIQIMIPRKGYQYHTTQLICYSSTLLTKSLCSFINGIELFNPSTIDNSSSHYKSWLPTIIMFSSVILIGVQKHGPMSDLMLFRNPFGQSWCLHR